MADVTPAYINVNAVNVLTIVVMASVGAILLGLIAAGIQTYWPGARVAE